MNYILRFFESYRPIPNPEKTACTPKVLNYKLYYKNAYYKNVQKLDWLEQLQLFIGKLQVCNSQKISNHEYEMRAFAKSKCARKRYRDSISPGAIWWQLCAPGISWRIVLLQLPLRLHPLASTTDPCCVPCRPLYVSVCSEAGRFIG